MTAGRDQGEGRKVGASPIGPRLLSTRQAAHYLGYTSPTVLRTLPIKPLRLGDGRAERWDVRVLDAYLDQQSGLASDAPIVVSEPTADDELEAWRAKRAARRS